jgi:hypothetical protein
MAMTGEYGHLTLMLEAVDAVVDDLAADFEDAAQQLADELAGVPQAAAGGRR